MRAALALLVLAGCAMPQYASRPVSFGAESMPFDQARAICAPRAQLAANQAKAAAPAGVLNCTTYGAGTQARTQCAPQPTIGTTMGAENAAAAAGKATYEGCLAEHGWRLERYCTQNCR